MSDLVPNPDTTPCLLCGTMQTIDRTLEPPAPGSRKRRVRLACGHDKNIVYRTKTKALKEAVERRLGAD